jgi:hypothetical protein
MILTTPDEPIQEDPEVPVIRHCADCQHFRQQSKTMGYCAAKVAYTPDISDLCSVWPEHPIKAATQSACNDILPIGWEDDF